MNESWRVLALFITLRAADTGEARSGVTRSRASQHGSRSEPSRLPSVDPQRSLLSL